MKLFGLTDKGKTRAENQDTFRIEELSEKVSLCTVCDGMGGANAGDQASMLAVYVYNTTVIQVLKKHSDEEFVPSISPQQLRRLFMSAVSRANTAVFEKSKTSPLLEGMGTTLVSALVTPEAIYALNVGDSRMYGSKDGTLEQITKDHSYVQYLVDEGVIEPDKAANHPKKNIITRAVGTNDYTEADYYEIPCDKYDKILLCSDGLSNFVSDEEINEIIKLDVAEAVHRLIERANENGGGDNITAVLVSLREVE